MREIKFRAKSGTQWRYGDLYHNERGELMIYEPKTRGRTLDGVPLDGWRIVVDPKTVGQFTGLLDADGREIYEGDIVSWGDGTPPTSVRWDEHFAYYVIMESLILSHACKAVRVIGNVYENPEMLEATE